MNKIGTNSNSTISNPVPKNNESFSKFIPSTPINTGKGSDASGNASTPTSKIENKVETKSDKKEERQEIRYPNKLTPKQTSSNGDTSSMDGTSKSKQNTNKGVASAPIQKQEEPLQRIRIMQTKIIQFTTTMVKIISLRICIQQTQDSL